MEDANGDRAEGHGDRVYPPSDARTLTGRRVRSYIGLGANVGDADGTLAAAVRALDELPAARVHGVSRLYATVPVGVTDQPEFRNAAVSLDVMVPTGTDPATGALALLSDLKGLERDFGRRRRARWGPRELDLDLLVFGRERLAVERPPAGRSLDARPRGAVSDPTAAAKLLVVPHPSAGARLFVLAPLADLVPGLVPPGWGRTVEAARRRQLAVEGPEAVRPIAQWDPRAQSWRPIQPR
jgi:2-amino-4-hydroxy-6-hydroxymethyldihydropteridine diphosphokinase